MRVVDFLVRNTIESLRYRRSKATPSGYSRLAQLAMALDLGSSFDESSDSNPSDSDSDESWVGWFHSSPGNEFLVEVETSYIEDNFNMYGLRQIVPHYTEAMHTILGVPHRSSEEEERGLENATQLYLLIHQRYILTPRGLEAMARRYRLGEFGTCPRLLCDSMRVVPTGRSHEYMQDKAGVYCPTCKDVYSMFRDRSAEVVDGAAFGPTFAALFFLTYQTQFLPFLSYTPRVFGYRIHDPKKSERQAIKNGEAKAEGKAKSGGRTPKKENGEERKTAENIATTAANLAATKVSNNHSAKKRRT